MAVAVSRALERGATGVVCASTGNTAASAAAYAARAGLAAVIVRRRAARSPGLKLAQVKRRRRGHPSRSTARSRTRTARRAGSPTRRATSTSTRSNPDRIEGQKTAALEIVEQLGAPARRAHAAVRRRRQHERVRARLRRAPARCRACIGEAERRHDTFASAIRIVDPVHQPQVEAACWRARAARRHLTEEQIEEAWRLVAPRGGTVLRARLRRRRRRGWPPPVPGGRVVCVLTGHGLKDPDAVERLAA